MFEKGELERLRLGYQRRVIVSGLALVIVLGFAMYLGRRQPRAAAAPTRDIEMAQHHVGR